MTKEQVHNAAIQYLENKIKNLNFILQEAYEAVAADGKSSAGDKHETATAMAQLEQEKLVQQLNELLQQKTMLEKINTSIRHNKIGLGSLVETNIGWFYISTGLGVINCDGKNFFCISPEAPIGKLLLDKKKGDNVLFNGKETKIIDTE